MTSGLQRKLLYPAEDALRARLPVADISPRAFPSPRLRLNEAVPVDTEFFSPLPPAPALCERLIPEDELLLAIDGFSQSSDLEYPLTALAGLADRRGVTAVLLDRDTVLDAKALIRARGRAGRAKVRLLAAPSPEERAALLATADGVLWAGEAPDSKNAPGWPKPMMEAAASARAIVTAEELALLGEELAVGPEGLGKLPPALRARGAGDRLTLLRALGSTDTEPPAPGDGDSAPSHALSSASRIAVSEPQTVVIAGHDLKFTGAIEEALKDAGHHVLRDEWAGHERHDPQASRRLAEKADVVFCEWTLGNAVWYSKNLPAGKRLVTRLHLQEASGSFPSRMNASRVDRVITVSDRLRRWVLRDHGLAPEQVVAIPNTVNMPESLPEEHDENRRFRIGLVGVVPARKGLAEALELLSQLRREDPRFSLHIKGRRPEEYAWLTERPEELAYYEAAYRRVDQDPHLGSAVRFEGFSPGLSDWYRSIGIGLSTSAFESFHYTLPDAAAHRALPASLAWPGADELYPVEWLAADVDSLTALISAATVSHEVWSERAHQAYDFVAAHYAAENVSQRLLAEILGA